MGLLGVGFKKLELLMKKIWNNKEFKAAAANFVLESFQIVVHTMMNGKENEKRES